MMMAMPSKFSRAQVVQRHHTSLPCLRPGCDSQHAHLPDRFKQGIQMSRTSYAIRARAVILSPLHSFQFLFVFLLLQFRGYGCNDALSPVATLSGCVIFASWARERGSIPRGLLHAMNRDSTGCGNIIWIRKWRRAPETRGIGKPTKSKIF